MNATQFDIWAMNNPDAARDYMHICNTYIFAILAIVMCVMAAKKWNKGDKKISTLLYGMSAVFMLISGALLITLIQDSLITNIFANMMFAYAFLITGYDIGKYQSYLKEQRRKNKIRRLKARG